MAGLRHGLAQVARHRDKFAVSVDRLPKKPATAKIADLPPRTMSRRGPASCRHRACACDRRFHRLIGRPYDQMARLISALSRVTEHADRTSGNEWAPSGGSKEAFARHASSGRNTSFRGVSRRLDAPAVALTVGRRDKELETAAGIEAAMKRRMGVAQSGIEHRKPPAIKGAVRVRGGADRDLPNLGYTWRAKGYETMNTGTYVPLIILAAIVITMIFARLWRQTGASSHNERENTHIAEARSRTVQYESHIARTDEELADRLLPSHSEAMILPLGAPMESEYATLRGSLS